MLIMATQYRFRLTLPARFRAMAFSLGITAAVALAVAALVFSIWYPTPFRQISGGNDLFAILVGADLVLGSIVTFVICDGRKPRHELIRDLLAVAFVQLSALGYGIHSMYEARPAVLALERDRVRVVRAADLDESAMEKAPNGLRNLSMSGPLLVAAEDDPADLFNSVMLAMNGHDIGTRPERWLPPSETAREWSRGSRPVLTLATRYPDKKEALEKAVAATGLPADRIGYLPLLARTTDWVVLVDISNGRIVGYAPCDGF